MPSSIKGIKNLDKKKINFLIIVTTLSLVAYGLFILYYSFIAYKGADFFSSYLNQLIAVAIGIACLFIFRSIKYQEYFKKIWLILICLIVAMLSLSFFGEEINGAVRWINLFNVITFQPGEILKIGAVIIFSYIFASRLELYKTKKIIILGGSTLLLIIFSAVLQPNYGMLVIIFSALFLMSLLSRIPKKILFIIIFALGSLFLLYTSIYAPYVYERFETFLTLNFGNPTQEFIYGQGYHSLQNINAVSSGGWIGQGIGTTSTNNFANVPELVTDSIFTLLASETGFIGVFLVILSYFFLISLLLLCAYKTADDRGRILVVGITSLLVTAILINLYVILGFANTGTTLPFFSKGGSSIIILLSSIGIALNVLKQQPS